MKTKSLVVMSALLMFTSITAFAQSHQEEVVCRMTADNCLHGDNTQNEVKMVASTSPESIETLEQKQADIRNRLHGSAYAKAEAKSSSPVNSETLEQMQEDFKNRLQGHAPGSRF